MADHLSLSERSMKWPPMFGRVPYERQSKSSDEQVERKILNDALGFTQRPHIQSILTPLQRPVEFPRLQSRVGAPFARLYAQSWHNVMYLWRNLLSSLTTWI